MVGIATANMIIMASTRMVASPAPTGPTGSSTPAQPDSVAAEGQQHDRSNPAAHRHPGSTTRRSRRILSFLV